MVSDRMKAKTPRPNLLSLINELLYPIPSEYPPSLLAHVPSTHILRLWGYYATVIYLGDARGGERKREKYVGADFNCLLSLLRDFLLILESWRSTNSIQTTQVICCRKLPLNHWDDDGKNSSLTHLAISLRPISCSNEAQLTPILLLLPQQSPLSHSLMLWAG